MLAHMVRGEFDVPQSPEYYKMLIKSPAKEPQALQHIRLPSSLPDGVRISSNILEARRLGNVIRRLKDILCIRKGVLYSSSLHAPAALVFMNEHGQTFANVYSFGDTPPFPVLRKSIWIISIAFPLFNVWHALHWWASTISIRPKHLNVLAIMFTNSIDNEYHIRKTRIYPPLLADFLAIHMPIFNMLDIEEVIFLPWKANSTLSVKDDACYFKAYAGGVEPLNIHNSKNERMNKAHIRRLRETFIPFVKTGQIPRRVVIINRGGTGVREFHNFENAMSELRQRIGHGAIQYYQKLEQVGDIVAQMKAVSSGRVLVAAHGAALAWMAFMASDPTRTSSCIIEVMVQSALSICIPGIWNFNNYTIYGGLARLSNMAHICVETLPYEMAAQKRQDAFNWMSVGVAIAQDWRQRTLLEFPVQEVAGLVNECLSV